MTIPVWLLWTIYFGTIAYLVAIFLSLAWLVWRLGGKHD